MIGGAICALVRHRRSAILKFAKRRPDALVPLINLCRITKRPDWGSLADVRNDFAHADIVGRRTLRIRCTPNCCRNLSQTHSHRSRTHPAYGDAASARRTRGPLPGRGSPCRSADSCRDVLVVE
ncbi:MAG: type II toxin-antitoxin system HigB family toxin [Acidobacteria bacterium]|nr:type II toxin-antitoxin system HigB family toxin [Acidobacteriota bacterium]